MKRLGATNKDLHEARSGIIRNSLEFEGLFLPESCMNVSKEKEYKIIIKHVRSLEFERIYLFNKSQYIFIKRKLLNRIKYIFKRSINEKSVAIWRMKSFKDVQQNFSKTRLSC